MAFQGSFDWNQQGFNLGVFGSNTVFSDHNLEIDLYGGYSWAWAGFKLARPAPVLHVPGRGRIELAGS
jgi:hypothetical protein